MNYDKIEIDNPDKRHPIRLMYIDRLRSIINIVKRQFPNPKDILIGDFACAQANIGLILAELGYKVFAIDIRSSSLEYSKMKYEKGDIEWIVSDILDLNFPSNTLDIAIAGELIEHCAYPEEIVKKIFGWVRPNGYLILTTPNGSRLKSNLPTFSQILERGKRKEFENTQFRPRGKDHLFLFKLNEIKYIVPKNSEILESGYCGDSVFLIICIYFYNKYSKTLLRIFPVHLLELTSRIFSKIPLINKKTCCNIYTVIKKK